MPETSVPLASSAANLALKSASSTRRLLKYSTCTESPKRLSVSFPGQQTEREGGEGGKDGVPSSEHMNPHKPSTWPRNSVLPDQAP